jgi:mxaD protein
MVLTRPLAISFVILATSIGSVSAHGPTPQKADEKISIAAPPAAVWDVIKEFGSIGNWHPGLAKVTSEGGNKEGATRTLTLKSGGEIVESLDAYDEREMSIEYRLLKENLDAFPVSFYSDQISVHPANGGSEVEWTSRFYRADTTNEPPEDKNDAAAIKATADFFKAGLSGIKTRAEGKGKG